MTASLAPETTADWWPKLTKRMLYAAQEEFHLLPPRMRRLWARMGELHHADAQVKADARDAERYRHLRSHDTSLGVYVLEETGIGTFERLVCGTELDTLIDTDIAAKEESHDDTTN